ncbi:hypothetical protein QEN19_003194 [Hanseniaspora menglaensis]
MSTESAINADITKPTDSSVSQQTHSIDIADLRYTMEQQHLQQLKLKQIQHQSIKDGVGSANNTNENYSDDHTSSPPSSTNGNTGPKIINFKNSIQQTTAANPDVLCSNCGTTKTPLWRRDERGYILCNACGLFFKLHGKPRPISLKTDVIRSRNRKTKIEKERERDLLSNSSVLTSPDGGSKHSSRKRKKKIESVAITNQKTNGLISTAALLGMSGNNSVDESFNNSSNNSSKSSAVYNQANGLIKIVPKIDGDYHNQSFSQPNFSVSNNSFNSGQPSSSANSVQNSNSKIIVLPQKLHSAGNGPQMLSLSKMGVSPRLGPLWQQSPQLSQHPQLSSFKSPPMLAIDKLASVSRQINKPVSNISEMTLQGLNNSNPNSSSKNTVLPPISHFQDTSAASQSQHNKLPNLKNILTSVENASQIKPLSISNVLNNDVNVNTDYNKDDQIKKLITENKELELKLDICKNKINELEKKLLKQNGD